jgi:hypothetical protein
VADLERLHINCSMPAAFQGGAVTAGRRRTGGRCRGYPEARVEAFGASRQGEPEGGGAPSWGSPEGDRRRGPAAVVAGLTVKRAENGSKRGEDDV